MRQILQNLKDGRIELAAVPVPSDKQGYGLIRTRLSLISAGTEKMLLEFGRSNLINKARQQPDKVRQVFEKIRTDGLLPTLDAVKARLDTPLPLGYCNVGTLLQAQGAEFTRTGLVPGSRVVSNGPHAEIVRVPRLLCASIPDAVSDETAAFTVLGAIALQGVRLASPTIGETVVVSGLGLIGQLTVQIMKANGCRVIGIDISTERCLLARQFGAETVDLSSGQDPLEIAASLTRGAGVDAVLITAATTSSEPVHQAARMCARRGRIVLVGVTGLQLNRADFYEKELTFQVSCSYGPGRYDPRYEEQGRDYPRGYVRWTEQRNFEAVLALMAEGKISIDALITHRFSFSAAPEAYDLIAAGKEPYMGILLEYEQAGADDAGRVSLKASTREYAVAPNRPVVGMLGAGLYTGRILLPALAKYDCSRKLIVSSSGVSGTHLGRQFGFDSSGTSSEEVFQDAGINTVFITTRHDSHASYVLRAIASGKHVFCEKPLCLTTAELEDISRAYRQSQDRKGGGHLLMVGFNRRFSPLIQKMKALLNGRSGPLSMVMNVNAGAIPADHWTQDAKIGGGRMAGEACHFIDLLFFICGSEIVRKHLMVMDDRQRDTFSIQLGFADGSIGTINYFANGHTAFPKERLQVYCAGRVLEMDNFRSLEGWGWPGFKNIKLWRQDKGHTAEIGQFIEAIATGKTAPIRFDEIYQVTHHTIVLAEALAQGTQTLRQAEAGT